MKNKYTFDSYLSFTLANEVFAANVAKVLNILEMVKITRIPEAPGYMLGVINLRGNVLPVIDLRIKLKTGDSKFTSNTCILVLDIEFDKEKLFVGAVVDSVQEVIEIKPENMLPPPNLGAKFKSKFIYAMAKHNDNFIMLLDMDKLFSSDELKELKENNIETA